MNRDEDNEELYVDGYDALCAAVLEMACKDYKRALIQQNKNAHSIGAKKMIYDCESFFQNEIALYSDMDGETIMRRIQEQVRKECGR